MSEAECIDWEPAEESAERGAKPKFVPPPKPVRTEQDWANIAYLEKLRECIDEEKPEGLPMASIVKVIDYSKPQETGLPASNVLQFYNEAGDVVTVRPSGTEPKIKFYFGIKGADADAKNEVLRAQFSR